ncbi:MAG: hypothetical protein KM310_02490 [Clostridiales bacterium]|nr:hypothetical protein [Clostridiales bacterium]
MRRRRSGWWTAGLVLLAIFIGNLLAAELRRWWPPLGTEGLLGFSPAELYLLGIVHLTVGLKMHITLLGGVAGLVALALAGRR